jgi:hypothetical protein
MGIVPEGRLLLEPLDYLPTIGANSHRFDAKKRIGKMN